ncbi:MAG: hypothetical protein ACXU86_05540 [Archangium sp.]
MPLVGPGIQVLRCGGCGAALQVSVRPVGPPKPPAAGESPARPRRRPMVELSGPRRAEPRPGHSFTVELSQSDIETGALETEAPPGTPARTPTIPPTSAPPPSVDMLWYAEDIERLPEATLALGQLALEDFEPVPPLPPGASASHLQGK